MAKFKLTLEQALQIEHELNEVLFDGIPAGGLFADYIYQSLYFHDQNTGIKSALYHYLLYKKISRQNITDDSFESIPPAVKYLYAYTVNVPKNNAFFNPLQHHFTKGELAFVSTPEQYNKEWNAWPFMAYNGLSQQCLAMWGTLYKTFEPAFAAKLSGLCRKHRLPAAVRFQFKQMAVLQTKKYVQMKYLLKNSSVKSILTDHDRQSLTACLILAARKLQIQTYTLVHGSTFPPDDYYPLLADYMFCWSETQKKQMQEVGIRADQLIVSGNQKLTRTFNLDKTELKNRFNIPTDKQIVLLATNPIRFEEKVRFAEEACAALNHENHFILIRIHPSENPDDYNSLKQRYPNLGITGSFEQTADESLAVCDQMVCHNTVFLIEALIKHIPVTIFAPAYISYPLGVGEDAYKAGAVQVAHTANELTKLLEQKLTPAQQASSEKYVNSICAYFGEDAAQIVTNHIRQEVLNPHNQIT